MSVPPATTDPAWTLVDDDGAAATAEPGDLGDGLDPAVVAALVTVGAGGVATRGAVLPAGPDADAGLVLCAGVYDGTGEGEHLLPGPCWSGLDVADPQRGRTELDLRDGVLTAELGDQVRAEVFASIARPGVVALRASGPPGRVAGGAALRAPRGAPYRCGTADGHVWARTDGTRAGRVSAGIVAAAHQQVRTEDGCTVVERTAALVGNGHRPPRVSDARALLDSTAPLGYDRLLDEHRAAWARRWREVGVDLPDDPVTEFALRFAVFQLWSNTGRHAELAVGARGLSGRGYSGHVFWDADLFVLPAMTTIAPEIAGAMVGYRLRRLDAARRRARREGRAGARFPWESASTGDDVTPTLNWVGGEARPVRTGALEEHITADIAWAACHHARWTGARPPQALLAETARYWATRVRTDGAGAHLDHVEGPDEYHSDVDDNAFTNVMARWNLRAAARDAGASRIERRAWFDLAASLVDGYDARRACHEQFRGYFGLTPLTMAEVAPPPVAADLLLGPDVVAASQLIKQPDAVMLHHLVPDELPAGSLDGDLDFYGPRTAHGSSLSPAVSAAVLARAGRADDALSLLRLAADIDLADAAGSGRGGLHVANLGGMWQALVRGFLGVSVDGDETGDTLALDPHLPERWPRVRVRLRVLCRRVVVTVEGGQVDVWADRPLRYRPHPGADARHARTGDDATEVWR